MDDLILEAVFPCSIENAHFLGLILSQSSQFKAILRHSQIWLIAVLV